MRYINQRANFFAHRVFHSGRRVKMKVIIALMFLAAVAVYAEEEMEYHPQAILHYLEMEDQEMARKVRSYLEPRLMGPTVLPHTATMRPSGSPTISGPVVSTLTGNLFLIHIL